MLLTHRHHFDEHVVQCECKYWESKQKRCAKKVNGIIIINITIISFVHVPSGLSPSVRLNWTMRKSVERWTKNKHFSTYYCKHWMVNNMKLKMRWQIMQRISHRMKDNEKKNLGAQYCPFGIFSLWFFLLFAVSKIISRPKIRGNRLWRHRTTIRIHPKHVRIHIKVNDEHKNSIIFRQTYKSIGKSTDDYGQFTRQTWIECDTADIRLHSHSTTIWLVCSPVLWMNASFFSRRRMNYYFASKKKKKKTSVNFTMRKHSLSVSDHSRPFLPLKSKLFFFFFVYFYCCFTYIS